VRRALVAMLFAALATAAHGDQELDAMFGRDVLIIVATEHACHRFDIYVAVSDAQRSRGLMFVREMPDTTGMLFVYAGNHRASMWMKNTYIPLDMVFARSDGSVSTVIADTEPLSLKSLSSIEPVMFVLELNAGIAERLGIDDGSRLVWEPALRDDE